MQRWRERTNISAQQIVKWMGIQEGTFYEWKKRYGKVSEHNGWIPRDHWLTDEEKQAILRFHFDHPL